jgi:23S rRNA (guanosine2251-2'-O)-methyltransferase
LSDVRWVAGVQPVLEALKGGQQVDRLFLARAGRGATHRVREAARAAGVKVEDTTKDELTKRLGSDRHQGVLALVEPGMADLTEVEEMVDAADARGEPPLILILDAIQDPGNLGAILRSAHALGAHGVVLPKNRSAQVTPMVVKASAGAALHVPVARFTNIKQALERLQTLGVWSAAASMEGAPVDEAPLTGPLALVVGSEAKGVRPSVARKCDHQVRIPQLESFDSLNASVAAGILLYEIQRQRRQAGGLA